METRDGFKSRLGFLLVSAGCAIGIGNVWRFPYVAGEYGGAVFVLFYLTFLILMGIPVLTMELAVGRGSGRSPLQGFKALEKPGTFWHLHGWTCFLGCFVLMIYYTTISGWMLNYVYKFVTGAFVGAKPEAVTAMFGAMNNNPLELTIFMGITVFVGFIVCAGGVASSLEKITKWVMLGLLALIIVLAVNSAMLPGSAKGLSFYLLPDWGRAMNAGLGNVATAAMNQAFFTLSVGQGSMAIFGSYMKKDHTLTGEAMRITALDTFVALMAGMIIFPACFAFGVQPDQGPSLIFVTMPNIFINMSMGQVWGVLFFVFMSFAAFSTVTAVFENLICNCKDVFNWSRKKAVLYLLPAVFFGSLPCIFGFSIWQDVQILGTRGILDSEDFIVSNLILPIGSLIFALFCSLRYGWGFENFRNEANTGKGLRLPLWLKPYFQFVLPVFIFVIIVRGLV